MPISVPFYQYYMPKEEPVFNKEEKELIVAALALAVKNLNTIDEKSRQDAKRALDLIDKLKQ